MTAPAPVLPTDTGQLGPGSLTIGTAGTSLDISCYVNNAGIEISKDTTDQTTKLCGASRPGVTTYTYTLSGNVDVDLANASGLLALSWDSPGSVQDFEFIPNTALGTSFTGQLTIDPLNVQADEYGADITSDFSWVIVGKPTRTVGGGAAVALTGVTAGSPGSFQPSNATVPANLTALKADPVVGDSGSNKPVAAWTTGQSVNLGTGSAHWSGTAWVAGVTP
jgi:hypothetical protein